MRLGSMRAARAASSAGRRLAQDPGTVVFQEEGKASFYGDELQGQKTASGAKFDPDAMTAAHPTLPLGTEVTVTDPATDKQVEVEINDRGPFVEGRDIDLSKGAAKKLGIDGKGVADVKIEATKAAGRTGDRCAGRGAQGPGPARHRPPRGSRRGHAAAEPGSAGHGWPALAGCWPGRCRRVGAVNLACSEVRAGSSGCRRTDRRALSRTCPRACRRPRTARLRLRPGRNRRWQRRRGFPWS